MFRSLFSIGAIFSLLFVSFGVPAANAARKRCPEEPPSTLLSLFKNSDAVYIGKFDKTTDGEVTRSDEDSKTISVSDHFSISTTIKGESRKFFVRSYDQYRYNTVATTVEAPVGEEISSDEMAEIEPSEEESDGDMYRSLRPGDRVMLFLSYAEDEEEEGSKKGKKTLDLTHYRDGIKRLDDTELSSYETRVRELKGILAKKNTNDADVLNWIIRCIEDPVTRWEGAFELQSSFENLDWKERSKNEHEDADEAETEATESEDSEEPVEAEIAEEDEFDNSVYASLLTDAQKARLMRIAVSSRPVNAEEKPILLRPGRDGDRVLFDVVKRWGDSKLASAMLDRLRSAGDNYEKQTWMSSIADVLKDKELSAISEKFGDATYQDDDEEFVGSKDEVEEDASDGPVVEPEKSDETKSESSDEVDDIENADKKTYKQYRDELLADFFGKAASIISQEKEKAKAK